MPPKAKIAKEMIVEAAFRIAKEEGANNISARTVSKKLECSTQPVMSHFKTIEELKSATYKMADEYHTKYIFNIQSEDPLKDIGLNYIRFAVEEKKLFCFLFQSNSFSGNSILDLMEANEIRPIIDILCSEADITAKQAKIVFRTVFLCVHGFASMLANNNMVYNEERVKENLDLVLCGTIGALKGDIK